jgi:hypothetical protein
MLLQDLQAYLKQQHRASLKDLEQRFHISADALRGMLNQYDSQGAHSEKGSKYAHCCQFAPDAIEFYEWMT